MKIFGSCSLKHNNQNNKHIFNTELSMDSQGQKIDLRQNKIAKWIKKKVNKTYFHSDLYHYFYIIIIKPV